MEMNWPPTLRIRKKEMKSLRRKMREDILEKLELARNTE